MGVGAVCARVPRGRGSAFPEPRSRARARAPGGGRMEREREKKGEARATVSWLSEEDDDHPRCGPEHLPRHHGDGFYFFALLFVSFRPPSISLQANALHASVSSRPSSPTAPSSPFLSSHRRRARPAAACLIIHHSANTLLSSASRPIKRKPRPLTPLHPFINSAWPATSRAYSPPAADRAAWSPTSPATPPDRTAIESAARTVDSRCATTRTVRPTIKARRPAWTPASDSASRAIVRERG